MAVAFPSGQPIVDNTDYSSLDFYPLDSPGMPIPGPDFIAAAQAMGDPLAKTKKVGDVHVLQSHGPALVDLYRRALYSRTFNLPIRQKGVVTSARFVPGHRWGDPPEMFGPTQRSKVMVISKCLGREEVFKGRCFVGEVSRTLAESLQQAGVSFASMHAWYVTNVVKHADVWGKSPTIPASIVKNCSLLLEQEVRLVRPDFVLCLGSEAARWMLNMTSGGVSESLGRVFTRKFRVDYPGQPELWHECKVMTCLHPAALIHAPARRDELDTTLVKFRRLIQGLEVDAMANRQIDHKVIFSLDELSQTIDQIIEEHRQSGQSAQKIAIDCEWHGDFYTASKRPLTKLPGGFQVDPSKGETEAWLRTFQFSHRKGFARCIILRDGGPREMSGRVDRVGMPAFLPSIKAAMTELRRLFTPTPGREIRLIGHNLRADLPWVATEDRELADLLIRLFDPVEPVSECRYRGGFDTLYGLHAADENAERKLEVAGMYLCGIPRYDMAINEEKRAICKRAGLKIKELPGYGEISNLKLHEYANHDVDVTICIEDELTKPGGLLDRDENSIDSWRSWHSSQGKMLAELEMETQGLLIDARRAEKLTAAYKTANENLKKKLADLTRWPDFNTASVYQVRTVLFGPLFAGKIDNKTGKRLDPRPASAMGCELLGLTPIKATGKQAPEWDRVIRDNKEMDLLPSTDKESLGILLSRAKQENNSRAVEVLDTIRSRRFVSKVLSTVLCPPDVDGKELEYDDDGDLVYDKGFLASVEPDNRVRTHFLPVDTHRVSSADPNIQNLSKRRENDLKRILGDLYEFPLRSIITSRPGYVLVDADLSGAELLMMAVQSGSAKMVDHCLRSAFPESDERHYDIHSRVAKACFKFDGPPLKGWLSQNGMSNLRDIAKTVAFGLPYGRGDAAILRGIEETGVVVTMEDVVKVRQVLFGEYPELEPFFQRCQSRVETHRYLRTCFQSTRRFADWGGKESVLKNMQRQAGNFPIQGGIADVLKLILRKFYHYPNRTCADGSKRFYLVAQVHDAVMSEVRIDSLPWYVKEVLPACMSNAALIYPCDLDGVPLPGREGVKLGYEYHIFKNWGEDLTEDSARELGLPSEFWPKKKKKAPTIAV